MSEPPVPAVSAPAPANSRPRDALLEVSALMGGMFGFWLWFASYVESFYRDDNVGGVGPMVRDMGMQLLHGRWPTHTEFVGGGGGAYLCPWGSGVLDPFMMLPAVLANDRPETLMNLMMTCHLALFAGGGWLMAHVLGAPRWARWVAGLSLGFSGYFVIWAGNWSTVLVPYAFLPWLLAAAVGSLQAQTRAALIRYELLFCLAVFETFLSGMLFAALYGGLVFLFLIAAWFLRSKASWTRLLRLLPPAAVFALIVVPGLVSQMAQYQFIGGRDNAAVHWVVLAVPLKSYLGLWLPSTSALWRTVFFPDGTLVTGLIMACGFVPIWYLTIDLMRRRLAYLAPPFLVLLFGVGLMVVVMSPGDLHLDALFARLPIVNSFRWPFRALPAFHILLVTLFAFAVADRAEQPPRLWRLLAPPLVVAISVLCLAFDLRKTVEHGEVMSWFRSTPRLNDAETWSPPTLATLRSAGFVANACRDEVVFYEKPRLFFYGTMGAEVGVHTVHTYSAPPFKAFEPLAVTIKGCMRKWSGIRTLIEQSPASPPNLQPRWNDYRGPRTFQEIVAKTFVGAVIVEPIFINAMRYFETTPGWVQVERHPRAVAFVRAQLLPNGGNGFAVRDIRPAH